MFSIYLAGMFSTIAKRKAQAAELRELGFDVTSRWIDETVPHTVEIKDVPEQYSKETAIADKEDIEAAEYFIEFVPTAEELVATTVSAMSRGGRHWEMGQADALGKEVLVVGPKENVFHFLPYVKHFESFNGVKAYLLDQAVNGRD